MVVRTLDAQECLDLSRRVMGPEQGGQVQWEDSRTRCDKEQALAVAPVDQVPSLMVASVECPGNYSPVTSTIRSVIT